MLAGLSRQHRAEVSIVRRVSLKADVVARSGVSGKDLDQHWSRWHGATRRTCKPLRARCADSDRLCLACAAQSPLTSASWAHRDLGQGWSDLAQVLSNWAQVKLSQLQLSCPNLLPNSARVHPTSAKPECLPISADCGQASTSLGQHWPKIRECSLDFGRNLARFG